MEKNYLVWNHYDYEGWDFKEFATLAEARKAALTTRSETFPVKITKLV